MADPVSPGLRQLVLDSLDLVLRSDSFRNSRQSEKLLRYLVQQSLDGRDDLLREKQVGVAVFAREPDYDTSTDAIVRVRVNELRKRLALYYEANPEPHPVTLRIPSGSYRVEFVRPLAAQGPAPLHPVVIPTTRRYRWRWIASVVVILCVGVAFGWSRYRRDALEGFWGPALSSGNPIILCSGNPVVYRYSQKFRTRLNLDPSDHFTSQTVVPTLPAETQIRPDDIVGVPNQYIGLGSAYAIAKVAAYLARHHQDSEIRFGNDISLTDLKRSPAVLIGAFQNRWTLEMMKQQRFVFASVGVQPGVRDQKTGKTWTLPNLREDGATTDDYVIITRVSLADTGKFVITAAGITQYGCQTAGDVLTNTDFLPSALSRIDSHWESRNAQILLHVPVIGQVPGAPTLVAATVW